MKKYALIPAFFAAFVAAASAQDNVRFNINGEIVARTCSVVGGADKTITMATQDIAVFAGAAVGKLVQGGGDDKATVSCPATTNVKISYRDLAGNAPAAANHLKNTATGGTASANVGVQVWFQTDQNRQSSPQGGFTMNTNVTRDFRPASGNDYVTMGDVNIWVKPYYYVMATPVTPGLVRSQMALTISYQ